MSSFEAEIRPENPIDLSSVLEYPVEIGVVGQEQGGGEEEREDSRKKKKIAAVATERTSTGTDITTPFGDVADDRAIVSENF